ncbi:hypothetical protein BFJ63_vAg5640 [Fusarium oxysporum f. sp. narcissi]|uniref:3-hydroxyisobutyrate dehydrogenase n=1 Tax=Fusarium oxysporum f. sp. narcissi TaxID=451672 RepID=A0A4Q2VXA6_FUSOX|nr:hypothetical protein BFJ63_vAg5640 [Fusarium oxysporum f. sp. narcissi]
MSVPDAKYGFIGVGQIGWGIAMNLRQKIPKGSSLVICEVSETRRSQFVNEAAPHGKVSTANSPIEVAKQADIIITMLPKSAHVRDVYTNDKIGLLSVGKRESPLHFFEYSTIKVATSIEVRKEVAKSGLGTFIDAPVSGRPNGANGGTLAIMVRGSEDQFEFSKPILKLMGKNIFHYGPSGAGLATKHINNYLSSVYTVGICKAMNMGIKYGLDPKKLASIINISSRRCYNSLEQNPIKGVTVGAASKINFIGGFSVELYKGVLDIAVQLGKEVSAQSILSDRVLGLYKKAIEDKRTQGRDSRSMYLLFADNNAA